MLLAWSPGSANGPSRLPQLIHRYSSHPPSRTHSSDNLTIRHIIFAVQHLLKLEKPDKAVKIFKKAMSKVPSNHHRFRPRAYNHVISAFLDHRRFKDAFELYQEMLANRLHASGGLSAKMVVCSSILKPPHEQREELSSLSDELSHILSRPSYSEDSLCELLDVMKSHRLLDSQFVSKVFDRYVDSRGSKLGLKSNTISALIRFYAHVGSIDKAENLLISDKGTNNQPQPADARPYTTLINELTNRGLLTSTRLKLLLDKMSQSQIKADLPLLNVLVQAAVRKRNFQQAFDLYETIMKDTALDMIPDSFVFGSLFNALQRLWSHNSVLRQARHPANAPTPRQLFRQMLECHVLSIQAAVPRRHPVVRVSTLNVALRVFMLSGDYPAAFVTLHTFSALKLKPDARSYRFVLTIILAHLERSLLKAADQSYSQSPSCRASWAVNFLGGPERTVRIQPEDVPQLAGALLEFAVGDTEYRVPTLATILGDRKASPLQGPKRWDVEPLERLVSRAILASMPRRSASEEQAERGLLEKLAPYFHEMVPNRLWRGRRLRRATG
jgi:pentatricopeptide repeat protein